jgi:hypothetical protein
MHGQENIKNITQQVIKDLTLDPTGLILTWAIEKKFHTIQLVWYRLITRTSPGFVLGTSHQPSQRFQITG